MRETRVYVKKDLKLFFFLVVVQEIRLKHDLYVATFFFSCFRLHCGGLVGVLTMNFNLWVHNLNLYYVYLTEISLTSRIDN